MFDKKGKNVSFRELLLLGGTVTFRIPSHCTETAEKKAWTYFVSRSGGGILRCLLLPPSLTGDLNKN